MTVKEQVAAAGISLLVIGGLAFITQKNGTVTLCNAKNVCISVSKTEYDLLRKQLASKVLAGQPLTIDEWIEYTGIVNNEARNKMTINGTGGLSKAIATQLSK